MEQLIKRMDVFGETPITFTGYKVTKFLVKNFSDDDIYVSLETPIIAAESFKIASKMYQVIFNNEDRRNSGLKEYDTIYVSGSGEVEVQAICFREDLP